MDWTREDTLGVANWSCVRCHGLGLKDGRMSSMQPCSCVLRAMFKACHEKFREVVTRENSRVELGGRHRRATWGHRDAEFAADFISMAKRTLSEEEHRVFTLRFLLGADSKLSCVRLRIDRGAFFHIVYRIEEKMGRACRETQPYALYPISSYYTTEV